MGHRDQRLIDVRGEFNYRMITVESNGSHCTTVRNKRDNISLKMRTSPFHTATSPRKSRAHAARNARAVSVKLAARIRPALPH